MATLLVQNGTLRQGDVIIAGTAVGRVRAMTNARGQKLTEAGPSVPVEIIGMGEVPGAGDDFHAVDDERMARELVEQRKHEQKMAASGPVGHKVSLEDLFSQIKQGEMKELPVSYTHLIYADVYHEPKAPAKPAAQNAGHQGGQKPAQNQAQNQNRPQGGQPRQGGSAAARPAQGQGQRPAQSAAGKPASRIPEKKIVDTRKGGDVNLEKYDERLEDLAAGKTKQMQAGKQKFQGRSGNQRRGGSFGNKRRQEEQDRMRRLQLEIAKKAPVKVLIPDEIGVGELASRMKKTGAEVVKCLMKNGVMASLSDIIDFDTAAIIAEEMGCKVEKEVIVTIEERLIDTAEDKDCLLYTSERALRGLSGQRGRGKALPRPGRKEGLRGPAQSV